MSLMAELGEGPAQSPKPGGNLLPQTSQHNTPQQQQFRMPMTQPPPNPMVIEPGLEELNDHNRLKFLLNDDGYL